MTKNKHSQTQDIASLQHAVTIVRQAALLAQRIQAEMIGRSPASAALNKSDRSPVTVADFAIQALVARRLMEAFPADPLVAEEDASALIGTPLLDQVTEFVSSLEPAATPQAVCDWIDRGHAGFSAQTPIPNRQPAISRSWLLDPIDGTKGFLRGGQYAVALALMVAGQPQIGVLGCPELHLTLPGKKNKAGTASLVAHGCLVFAVRGQGTWMTSLEEDGEPEEGTPHLFARLHGSRRRDPSRARLLRSFEAGHTNVGQIDQFAASLGIRAKPVLMDSQVKYAVLAAGQGDLMLRLLSSEQRDYREKAWDQAAGLLVVEEAGGRVTDLDGKPFDFTTGRELIHNRGVLVSNGYLHEAALRALKTIGA